MKHILATILFVLIWDRSALAQSEISTIAVEASQDSEAPAISGFPGVSAQELPQSTQVISSKDMEERNSNRLSEVVQSEASITDSYNATGYWDYISIRGFTLDNRENFQREGLPISAETSIPLENKERIEILKGLGGLQAGVGSPGGLVNYVVKRPVEKEFKSARVEFSEKNNTLFALDTGGRAKETQVGYRLNLAHENLAPQLRNAEGERSFVGAALDWRVGDSQLLEAELEWSLRRQPSQAGFSLLGAVLPEVQDPFLNLNNQPWSRPVEFAGLTGTLRYTQWLSADSEWGVTVGSQQLRTDDHLAYPFGCSSENSYDRFCSDGTFDLYDYRSEGEVRRVDAGKVYWGRSHLWNDWRHQIRVGLLSSVFRERFQRQAYNLVGVGNVQGSAVLPEDPSLTSESTNRDSVTTELFLNESLGRGAWRTWWGARLGRLHRSSVRTDGSRATGYSQDFPLPWLAVSYDFSSFLTYASWGQGLESFVTPNKSGYNRPGDFVAGIISEQLEVGARGKNAGTSWNITWFHLQRPLVEDQKPFYQIDAKAIHQGVEAQLSQELNFWEIAGSVMLLDARREEGSLSASLNGRKPSNVPNSTLRGHLKYHVSAIQGLTVDARVSREGERAVLADNSLMLPAWTQWDLGAVYSFKVDRAPLKAAISIENALDQYFWRESPTQYGHVYLYPAKGRTIYLSLQAAL